jgi:DME family drug/metabolite transporter
MSASIDARPAAHPILGLGLVCLAAALWATVGVASRLTPGIAGLDPAVVGLARTTLGALLLLAAARLFARRGGGGPMPVRALAIFGIAGAAFQVSLFEAFTYVGVTVTVAVTVCAPPLIVALGDALYRRRSPDPGVLAAIAVAGGGVFLLLLSDGFDDAAPPVDAYGVAILATASCAFACLAVAARVVARHLHPLSATGLGLACAAVMLAVVVALRHLGGATLPPLGILDLALLAYMGIAATGCAYLAFVLGMKLCRSAGAGLAATMVEPVLAAALAALLLQERLDAKAVTGCVLTLVALLVLFRAQRRAEAPAAG